LFLKSEGFCYYVIPAVTYTYALLMFQGHTNTKGIPLEVSFSPDSMFVFSGSTDGRVHCWSTDTGARIATMSCDHPGPVQCVGFNPKYMMLATACTNMVGLLLCK